jgi:hypothetical protein
MTTACTVYRKSVFDNIKLDALNYLNEKKDEIQLNLRSLIITSKLRKAHPDSWKDLANYMISTK